MILFRTRRKHDIAAYALHEAMSGVKEQYEKDPLNGKHSVRVIGFEVTLDLDCSKFHKRGKRAENISIICKDESLDRWNDPSLRKSFK